MKTVIVSDLSDVQFNTSGDNVFVHVIQNGLDTHPRLSSICSIFCLVGDVLYIIGTGHPDLVKFDFNFTLTFLKEKFNLIFVKDIKRLSHYSEIFLSSNFQDLDVYCYCKLGNVIELDRTFASKSIEFSVGKSQLNLFVPINKHIEEFLNMLSNITFPSEIELKEPGYLSIRNIIIPSLFSIEKSGLYIDSTVFFEHFDGAYVKNIFENKVYNIYNLWSSTGRPSNSFDGVNFAALNKENGERSAIKSRFDGGNLILMDFRAYHPRLLAKLSNFKIPNHVDDVYSWLAKQMIGKEKISQDELKCAKGEVFHQLYGFIQEKNLKIPFFKYIQEFITNRWKFFQKNGYIDTPMYNRSINSNHIESPFPNKVVNYLLQAYETERNCKIILDINAILQNKNTKLIHYGYDSFLFDVSPDEMDVIPRFLRCMCDSVEFPVTVKIGKTFHMMEEFKFVT